METCFQVKPEKVQLIANYADLFLDEHALTQIVKEMKRAIKNID